MGLERSTSRSWTLEKETELQLTGSRLIGNRSCASFSWWNDHRGSTSRASRFDFGDALSGVVVADIV